MTKQVIELLTQIKTAYAYKIVIDHHIQFHENPSFSSRDFCKTILMFVQSLIFNVFSQIFIIKPLKYTNL